MHPATARKPWVEGVSRFRSGMRQAGGPGGEHISHIRCRSVFRVHVTTAGRVGHGREEHSFIRSPAKKVSIFDNSLRGEWSSKSSTGLLPDGRWADPPGIDLHRERLPGAGELRRPAVRSRPEPVQSIHEGFLLAGSDAVETDTFGANKHVLSEFDEEVVGWTRSLNRRAAEIARAACEVHSTPDRPRFVLGSMGPGTKLITLGQIHWDDMLESYREQARGLLEGGVDAFLIETCQDLLQIKCASRLPVRPR